MDKKVKATLDQNLKVKIVNSTPMEYREGADESIDRPPHVRAASGVTNFAEYIAIVQDDANFLVLIEDDHHHVQSVPLPAGPGGKRVFDFDRQNQRDKLDLEGCVSVPGTNGDRLFSMGSGSDESRNWILLVELDDSDINDHDIELIEANRFYNYLRSVKEFSGSRLNVEGIVFDDHDSLLLFNRGNSAPKDGLEPVDAIAELSWPQLKAHLENPDDVDPPELSNIKQYDLGELDGVPLTFSDGMHLGDYILFSASAEGEDDYIAGSSIGVIQDDTVRWSEVIDQDGTAFEGKIEGLIVDPDDRQTVYFVIDDDQADQPSEIFEAELEGDWFK